MIFQFDLARLELFQRESLLKILDVIQSENVGEIVVCAVKLPSVYLILADSKIELIQSLECKGSACPVCQNLNPNRSHGQLPKRSRSRIRALRRTPGRTRHRPPRMPVRAARYSLDGRLQR